MRGRGKAGKRRLEDEAGSNRGRLLGLTPEERLKQMDRDALNARYIPCRARVLAQRVTLVNIWEERQAGQYACK